MGSHSFLQGIFPTQIIEPGLLHCRQILYIWTTREALNNTGLPHNFQSDFTHISLISFLLNRSVVSNSLQPHGLYSLWNSPGQNTGVGSVSLLQGTFPTQGSNPSLHVLQADSLPAEPQGTPKNTGVGSLSLLQGIFPTQESNPGLLHCMQILYQLSYQGSPTEGEGSKQGKSRVKSM